MFVNIFLSISFSLFLSSIISFGDFSLSLSSSPLILKSIRLSFTFIFIFGDIFFLFSFSFKFSSFSLFDSPLIPFFLCFFFIKRL